MRRKQRAKTRSILQPSKLIAKQRSVTVVERAGLGRGLLSTLKVKPKAKICVVRSVGGIGDVLMMTPGLRELKRRFPESLLTVAVDRHRTHDDCYYEMLKNAPFIDKIIDARHVDRNRFSKTIDISAVSIPYERRGLPARNRINIFANFLGLQKLENSLPFYKVERHEFNKAFKLIEKKRGSFDGPVITLHTASHDKKRSWPVEKNIEFLEALRKKIPNAFIIVFDFNNTYLDWSKIPGVYNASSTTVREMASLIAVSRVFIGPDSGPMHIAGALEVPSVTLFGAIPPEARINHYESHEALTVGNLPCLGCWYEACPYKFKCMTDLTVEPVVDMVQSKLQSGRVSLVFQSVLDPCDGYGSSAEQTVLALSDMVPSIRYAATHVNPDWERLADPRTKRFFEKKSEGRKYLGYYAVSSMGVNDVPRLAWRAENRYIYTTFESTLPPANWAHHINCFEKLFVSCNMTSKGFQDIGVEVPVSIVPFGVNEELWPYRKRSNKNRPLRFLLFANAEWSDGRKNYVAAFNAFKKAFGNNRNVELWLKVTSGEVPPHVSMSPNVKVINGRFTQQELLELLYNVDCLLFPSKGEGYGLPPREAMCSGIPVVAANFGGLESIMNLDLNYSLDYKLVNASYNLPEYIRDNNGSANFGKWARPDEQSFKSTLLHILDNRAELVERGANCAEWIRNNETYRHTAEKLITEMK